MVTEWGTPSVDFRCLGQSSSAGGSTSCPSAIKRPVAGFLGSRRVSKRPSTYTNSWPPQHIQNAWESNGAKMAPQGEATLPATRRTRKSIGGGPSTRRTLDKENATLDVGSATGGTRKKSRSKSMGPGGLDPLKMGTGNRRAVSFQAGHRCG